MKIQGDGKTKRKIGLSRFSMEVGVSFAYITAKSMLIEKVLEVFAVQIMIEGTNRAYLCY
jgi:hypothetical protein